MVNIAGVSVACIVVLKIAPVSIHSRADNAFNLRLMTFLRTTFNGALLGEFSIFQVPLFTNPARRLMNSLHRILHAVLSQRVIFNIRLAPINSHCDTMATTKAVTEGIVESELSTFEIEAFSLDG